jgi:hypothetical protein
MSSPHDRLFGFVMGHPALAAAWVRSLLPAAIAALIDWPSFTPAPTTVFGVRLRRSHADLVYVVGFRLSERTLVLPIEHKSTPDSALVPQAVRYAVHLRHTWNRNGQVALVLTLVLSHGEPAAALSETLPDLPPEAAALLRFQPNMELVLQDLSMATEAELVAADSPPLVRLMFLCLQFGRGQEPVALLACIDRWGGLIAAVEAAPGPPTPADALGAILCYLLETTTIDEGPLHMAITRHLYHPEELPMTTGQRLRNEGKLEGKIEGKIEGKLEGQVGVLHRLLKRRFGALPAAIVARLQAADQAKLDRLADGLLDAASLTELFGAPED